MDRQFHTRVCQRQTYFAGGENMHSRFEYVSAQTMDRVIDVLFGNEQVKC